MTPLPNTSARPRLFALIPVVACLIIAIGIIPPRYESRYEQLWYPQQTQSWKGTVQYVAELGKVRVGLG